MSDSKQTNPLQDMFVGVEKIIDFMETKDVREAALYETPEIRDESEMWMNAMTGDDNYITYRMYWTQSMFREIITNTKLKDINRWINNPFTVPVEYRDNLLEKGRKAFLDSYIEKNDYYRMLNGLPPIDTPESDFIYLTDPMRNQLHASSDPVHLLSPLIQNNFMNTDEYKQVLLDNPDKKYLKYLGLYKIDIYTARKAKDFEIIRYPLNRPDINPNLVKEYAYLYDSYREYVMATLYNDNFEGIYPNYRNFMGLLIQMFVLMQLCNKGVESINDRNYIDDSVLHIILSMYDIPNTLLMTNEVRRNLCINMLKLVREKGTDDVYYDLIDILGYQDIVISKLMLMKGQLFDENENPIIEDGKPKVDPYFVQVDIKDTNPYDTITSGKATRYDYHTIIDDDPTWWDLPDTREILENSNYTVADSKYITVNAVIHQIKYLFESIYFSRLVLDNKSSTDNFMMEIPEIFGTEMVSIYDLMVFIISAMCLSNNISGEIVTEEDKLLATAGFNFDMDLDSFTEFVNTTRYVDKERVMSFMENLTMNDKSDINRIFNDIMYPMREWLEYRVANAENRQEYLEYEAIYKSLYTYDASRNSILESFQSPMEIIMERYNISEDDMLAYKHFYPRELSGEKVTLMHLNTESGYDIPFMTLTRDNDRISIPTDYYIHVVIDDVTFGEVDRGYLYFHDILNSPDVRWVQGTFIEKDKDGNTIETTKMNNFIFMDYNDMEVGWEVNTQAVNKAIELIDRLDENALRSAFFAKTIQTARGGPKYQAGQKLPASIRSGIYKNILKEKLLMDIQGLSEQPKTYIEYLYRKNEKLYNVLMKDNRFELDKENWINDVMRIVLAVETELSIHVKYFEQSVLGSEYFFKPLITLIKHFKSRFVDISRTGLSYVFGDKVDTGGNSNMLKLFDEVKFVINFITLSQNGFNSALGLYDTEHKSKFHIEINDRSELLRMIKTGFDASVRESRMGSIHLVDEVKFFKNGDPIDPAGHPSMWYSGEPNTGRWSEEDDVLFRIRKDNTRVQNAPVDLEAWQDYVESYNNL